MKALFSAILLLTGIFAGSYSVVAQEVGDMLSNGNTGVPENPKSWEFSGVGYMGVAAIPIPYPSVQVSLGVIKNEKYFFGAGVGTFCMMARYHDADPENKGMWVLPVPMVYGQVDLYMKRLKHSTPYFTIAVGGTYFFKAGYCKLGFGWDCRSFVWELAFTPACFSFAFVPGASFSFGYRFYTAKHYGRKNLEKKQE